MSINIDAYHQNCQVEHVEFLQSVTNLQSGHHHRVAPFSGASASTGDLSRTNNRHETRQYYCSIKFSVMCTFQYLACNLYLLRKSTINFFDL